MDENVENIGEPTNLEDLFEKPLWVRSIALTAIVPMVTIFFIWFARPVLVPIVCAVLLQYLFAPLVKRLRKWRVPGELAALGVLVFVGAVFVLAVSQLATPAARWLEELPLALRDREREIEALTEPVQQMKETAKEFEDLADLDDTPAYRRPVVVDSSPSLVEVLLGGTWRFLGGVMVTFALLFFLLATQDSFLQKVVRSLSTFADKKLAVEIARGIESQMSRYIVTVSIVNSLLGLTIGLACWGFGLPNPTLWGVLAGVLNFVPYMGAMTGCTVVALVALTSMDSLTPAIGITTTYVVLTGIEGMLLTPLILGRTFTLSPVVVFIWFVFWAWIWGVPGALISMPTLVATRIICQHVPPLKPLGTFMLR